MKLYNQEINIKPFFSVIVPVYNKEQYIARSINSILNQTYKNFELIIVCDPSKDNSNKEVNNFIDERIKVFYRNQPGPGGYAARNLGIKEAKGDWIAFLDADDEWYYNHLEKMTNIMSKYKEERLFTCSKLIEQKGFCELDKFSRQFKCNDKKFTYKDYLYYSCKFDKPFNTNSVIVHKSLFLNGTFFPHGRTKRSGDIYTWVKLVAKAKVFVWSSHIGSHAYKDVIGVSILNTPTISLNIDMVKELSLTSTKEEMKWLKRYANKLIKTAWLENQKNGISVEPMYKYLFWRDGFLNNCLYTMVSMLPKKLVDKLRLIKKNIFRI